jgi:YidC/Oxa1 family membrane protein insertase
MQFFFITIYQPIYNSLIGLYDIFGDFGIAIIILTLVVKFALIPLSRKQIASQKEMQELQPKIKELQKKYKNDKEQLSRKTMALYKEHKVNPAAGCLPLIVQMIIFITMYRVIMNLSQDNILSVHPEQLYPFIAMPGEINQLFLSIMDLTQPNVLIAIITAAAQFYQLKMMQAKNTPSEPATDPKENSGDQPDFATIMQKQMLFIVPIMTLFIGLKFPSGLTLYWLTSTVFMIVQQWIFMKKEKKTAISDN